MAEIATVARPYAQALFQAAAADLEAALGWVQAVAQVAADPHLQQFAADPRLSSSQVVELVLAVAGLDQTNGLAKNFVTEVVQNGRLAALVEIAAQFKRLVNSSKGVCDAVVYSAFPMEEPALADLVALLEKRFARKLNVSVQVDEALIGGVRVVVGDEVLDTSVRARLDQMKVALTA